LLFDGAASVLLPWGVFVPVAPPPAYRVYVSYWYYKRQDIPSGVKNRPPGKEKTAGELYFSTHLDENKVQTLMGTCKVFNRPLWLEQGSKKAPLHHHFCTKVYDLQAQYVGWGS